MQAISVCDHLLRNMNKPLCSVCCTHASLATLTVALKLNGRSVRKAAKPVTLQNSELDLGAQLACWGLPCKVGEAVPLSSSRMLQTLPAWWLGALTDPRQLCNPNHLTQEALSVGIDRCGPIVTSRSFPCYLDSASKFT
jgi:hypothetical protein